MRFETWVERQIREAQERGEFDDLPGAGQPLPASPDSTTSSWVKRVAEREHLSLLPPMLALRKEAEEFLDDLRSITSEAAVRDLVADYNTRVIEAIRRPAEGPLIAIPRRLDIDEVLAEWVDSGQHHATPVRNQQVVHSDNPNPDGGVAGGAIRSC